AEPNDELREKVSGVTENTIHRAGSSLNRAAPTIGRGVEILADKAGGALHLAAGPLGRVLGAIAATLGGWWKTASTEGQTLPLTVDEVCRNHFATLAAL